MRAFHFPVIRQWLAAGAIALAACGDGTTGPGQEPEIINTTDNFQYQITDIQDFTGTQTYTWSNTGTTATVNQSASIASGAVSLVLLDGNGTQVYSRSLADNGTYTSDAGVAGTWTVRVTYSAADATVNFRVD